MPDFIFNQGSPLVSDLDGPVGVAAPVPFWSAVQAGFDDTVKTRNVNAREAQYQDRLWKRHREVERLSGEKLPLPMELAGVGPKGETLPGVVADDVYEARIAEIEARRPGVLATVPSRRQILDQLSLDLGRVRQRADEAWDAPNAGAKVGGFVGAAAGVMTDPVNIIGTALTGGAGASKPLAQRILMQAAANAGIEFGQIPLRMEDAQVAGPDYKIQEAGQDVAGAALFGAAFEPLGDLAKLGFKQLRGLRPTIEAEPALRGALNLAEAGERDAMVLGDLPGEDYDRALGALESGAPAPRLEPDRELADLFTGGDATVDYKGRPISATSFDPATLATDPGRFQYKAGGDAEGVTARLRGVEAWDPLAAGRVMVWEDAQGARFVADGHQRFGLIRRLNDDRGFEHQLDGFLFREADGWKASEVRVMAALKNIREGSGSALDAAKVFREAPAALADRSLPMTGDFMAQARGLASLSPEAFGAVVNKVIPERYAAEIGQMAAGRPDLHADMVRLMKTAKPANADEAQALVVEAMQNDWIKTEGETGDLFGYDPSVSAMIGRAKVAASVKRALARDAKLFGQLVKNADAIEAGGNALARDANQARLATDRAALEVTAKLALRAGPIGEAMAQAAAKVAKGETPASAAKPVLARVREALEAGERLDETRGVALDPPAPSRTAEATLKGFDDPAGEGAKRQVVAAPEDAEFEAEGPPGLFDDLPVNGNYAKARDALIACIPGE